MAGKSRKLGDEFGCQIGKKANENNDLDVGGESGIRTHGIAPFKPLKTLNNFSVPGPESAMKTS